MPIRFQSDAYPFLSGQSRNSTYSLISSILALFTPGAEASKTMTPGVSSVCTTAVSCPLKRDICGAWKDSSDEGSPLAAAR